MPLINFAGLASGIDSEALIDATSAASRQARVDPFEQQIADLRGTNTAFEDLQTLMLELKSTLSKFTTLNGGIVAKAFDSSDSSTISGSASNAASPGTFSITPTQLAKNATYSFDDQFFGGGATVLAATESATITVTVGGGTPFILNVDDTTTWGQLVSDFNAATDDATASLVKVQTDPTRYKFVVNTHDTGTANGSLSVVVAGTGTASIGDGASDSTLDDAANAELTMSGVSGTITRATNTINDLIEGVTLNLADTSATPINVTIGYDAKKTADSVQEFVDKYNEIVEFIADNNLIERLEEGAEVENVFGPLASSRVDDNALRSLRSAISGSSVSNGTAVAIFADLGITTDRDGTLIFDSDDLSDALSEDPFSVDEILKKFGDATAKTGAAIDQYTRFKGLIDLAIDGNTALIENLNDRIRRAEESITKQEELLRSRFARLESTISRLQSEQGALTSALASLSA